MGAAVPGSRPAGGHRRKLHLDSDCCLEPTLGPGPGQLLTLMTVWLSVHRRSLGDFRHVELVPLVPPPKQESRPPARRCPRRSQSLLLSCH